MRRPPGPGVLAVIRVPNPGSLRARSRAPGRGRVGDDRLGALPAEGRERGTDLGHHAAGDDARRDQLLRLARRERVEPPAGGVAHAVDVGEEHQLAGPETGGDAGRRVVGVDVADDPVGVARERRDDRDLAADEDRVEEIATEPDDAGDEAEVRDPLGDEEAAIDPGQPDRVDAEVAQAGHQLAVDDAPQDGRRDLERLGVGDPEAALEPARDAEPLEPLGDPLAAAVDEHDRPAARDGGDLVQHLSLLGDRRATQLDDEDLAHVVYSEFSMTYVSVRSQPNASPVPLPSPRSRAMTTSGASIAARAAARSNATGPPCEPSKTRWPAIPIRSRPGSTVAGSPRPGARLVRLEPGGLEHGRRGQPGVARRARRSDPSSGRGRAPRP